MQIWGDFRRYINFFCIIFIHLRGLEVYYFLFRKVNFLGVRNDWSEPEDGGRGESDGGEEGLRAPIVACCEASPVVQAAEHGPVG